MWTAANKDEIVRTCFYSCEQWPRLLINLAGRATRNLYFLSQTGAAAGVGVGVGAGVGAGVGLQMQTVESIDITREFGIYYKVDNTPGGASSCSFGHQSASSPW